MGFGFLAMVIAYVPVLYQSFSRREARITMLDEYFKTLSAEPFPSGRRRRRA